MLRLERTPLRLTANVSYGWTGHLRFVLLGVQRLFITVLILPLVILGAIILITTRQAATLAILLIVPAYYCCFLAAVAVCKVTGTARLSGRKEPRSPSLTDSMG